MIKASQFDILLLVLSEEDIGRVDVSMDNAFSMNIVNGLGQLVKDSPD